MQSLIEVFQYPFIQKALLASMMVGLMCGVLGTYIVLRNMSLIGDALSHAVLPGIVFAFLIVGYSAIGFFVGSVLAGLIAAALITWIQTEVKTKNDAAIGIVFTAMFSIGVIGITTISKGDHAHLDLKDFLFGNILGIDDEDMFIILGVSIVVLLSIGLMRRPLFASTFQPVVAKTMGIPTKSLHYFLMLMLSLVVVASLRTVGVILVVAMLITPASTALLLTDRLKNTVFLSGVVGMSCAAVGMFLAIVVDTSPGPMMALVATTVYLIAAVLSPKKGILIKQLRRQKVQLDIHAEDVLKFLFKRSQGKAITLQALNTGIELSQKKLKVLLQKMKKQGLIEISAAGVSLKESGKKKANKLIRAHRLWETYMVSKMGMNSEQIHEEAERIEHHISEELLTEIDQELGYPQLDPHGSPIPKEGSIQFTPMGALQVGDSAQLAPQQPFEDAIRQLWVLGIKPGTAFKLLSYSQDGISIIQIEDGETFEIPAHLVSQVNITNSLHKSEKRTM